MKMKLVILLLGLGGGAAGMHYSGDSIRQAVGLVGREVEAQVLEERRDDDGRLVLMLDSEGESMLATFRERADDVARLVQVGDIVVFRAPVDGVFSDDVPLLSVRRGGSEGDDEGEDRDDEDEEDEGDEESEDAEDSTEMNEDEDEAETADEPEETMETQETEETEETAPVAETEPEGGEPESAES